MAIAQNKKMATSNRSVLAARESRDQARMAAKRARDEKRAAKAETKLAKKEARQERKALVKEYGKLALVFGFAVAAGATVGGQLARIDRPWIGKLQALFVVLGLLTIALAKHRIWMQVAGISLISMGGVKLSDLSRTRDWIPGDNEWERPLPEPGTEGFRIEVVPNNG